MRKIGFSYLLRVKGEHGGAAKTLLHLRLTCSYTVWEAAIKEELVCKRKPDNTQDCYDENILHA